jgi:hypothetical protein
LRIQESESRSQEKDAGSVNAVINSLLRTQGGCFKPHHRRYRGNIKKKTIELNRNLWGVAKPGSSKKLFMMAEKSFLLKTDLF